jgi:hypothetical protein
MQSHLLRDETKALTRWILLRGLTNLEEDVFLSDARWLPRKRKGSRGCLFLFG